MKAFKTLLNLIYKCVIFTFVVFLIWAMLWQLLGLKLFLGVIKGLFI